MLKERDQASATMQVAAFVAQVWCRIDPLWSMHSKTCTKLFCKFELRIEQLQTVKIYIYIKYIYQIDRVKENTSNVEILLKKTSVC